MDIFAVQQSETPLKKIELKLLLNIENENEFKGIAIESVLTEYILILILIINKLNNNASDHLPVLVKYEPNNTSEIYTKEITNN